MRAWGGGGRGRQYCSAVLLCFMKLNGIKLKETFVRILFGIDSLVISSWIT